MLNKLREMLFHKDASYENYEDEEIMDDDWELRELIALAYSALNDWQVAGEKFRSVSDPELVDTAALELEASKMRYSYFLRILKERYPRINVMGQTYL